MYLRWEILSQKELSKVLLNRWVNTLKQMKWWQSLRLTRSMSTSGPQTQVSFKSTLQTRETLWLWTLSSLKLIPKEKQGQEELRKKKNKLPRNRKNQLNQKRKRRNLNLRNKSLPLKSLHHLNSLHQLLSLLRLSNRRAIRHLKV